LPTFHILECFPLLFKSVGTISFFKGDRNSKNPN
jgi:hypothetical protein